jgi:hypothetical protein
LSLLPKVSIAKRSIERGARSITSLATASTGDAKRLFAPTTSSPAPSATPALTTPATPAVIEPTRPTGVWRTRVSAFRAVRELFGALDWLDDTNVGRACHPKLVQKRPISARICRNFRSVRLGMTSAADLPA